MDTVSFWRFQPTAAVAQLNDAIALTDQGTFLFYASQPSLDGNRTFDTNCDRKEANTAILGCYAAEKIYLFDVTDERLKGIEEVTAAHELLHAVYQRLSLTEKGEVDRLVDAEYETLKSDTKLAQRMAFYDRTEPGERRNELHSIIGTEAQTVSPALEAHYAKYFKDRKKIVAYHDSYQQVFTELESQRETLSSQLDSLSKEIKRLSQQYNSDAQQLDADITTFNTRATNGSFSSQSQFLQERASLVAKVDELTAQRAMINAKVAAYDKLRTQYNDTVTTSNDLYKSIDSSLAPAPKV